MFVYGLLMLVGLVLSMMKDAGNRTFDLGAVLLFVYVLLTLVK